MLHLLELPLLFHDGGDVHDLNRQLISIDLSTVSIALLVMLDTVLRIPFGLVVLIEEHLVFDVTELDVVWLLLKLLRVQDGVNLSWIRLLALAGLGV